MPKTLDGILVLEMGTFITGPAAAMLLADLGAEVIKIERPETGDPYREYKGSLYSTHFQSYNRNKKSVALDTSKPEDRAIFHRMVEQADVFIQNFRPGVAEKLGAGEAELRRLNERLVYCAISGFGSSGPDRDKPAFDTVAQAISGYLRLLVRPESPRVVGPAIADVVTGFYAALGTLAALVERGGTGRGRRVDVSMLEAMCHFNIDSFTHYFSAGEVMTPYSRPSVSQSYVFACADAKWVALHMSSPQKFWTGLANALDRPNLFDDPRFASREARIQHHAVLIDLMAPIFLTRPLAEWCSRLDREDVPHAPAYDSDEALRTPQAEHLQLLIETQHPTIGIFRTVRSPLSFDGKRSTTVTAPPVLDEHGAEVRARFGGTPVDTEQALTKQRPLPARGAGGD